jgi:hypothetical protein
MASWILRKKDDFDNATVDCLTNVGNGTITEPGGSDLVIDCPNGIYCRWESFEEGPIGYYRISDHTPEGRDDGVFRTVCRVADFTGLSNWTIFGPTIFQDLDNAYQWGFREEGDDIYLKEILSNVLYNRYDGPGITRPSAASPARFRITWNSADRVVYVDGRRILQNEAIFEHSADDGASWTFYHRRTFTWRPTFFGVYVNKWYFSAQSTVDFDWTELWELDEEDVYRERMPGTDVPDHADPYKTDPVSKGMLEDTSRGVSTGGPPQGGDGLGHGQRIPGPVGQDTTLPTGPEDRMLLEDTAVGLDSGGPPSWNPDGLRMGYLGPVTKGLLEEDLIALADPDASWMIEKADGDGNDLLYDTDDRVVALIDTTGGSFGVPANNHYGAAKNGKWYYDGTECGTSGYSFGTLAGGFNRLAWRYTNDEPLASRSPIVNSNALVGDDQLRMSGDTWGTWANPVTVNSRMKWHLEGDFDIQVDYSGYNGGTNQVAAGLYLIANSGGTEGTNSMGMERVRNGYEFTRTNNGAWANLGSFSSSDTGGKLRFTRVGSTISGYRWTGSTWAQVGTGYTHPVIGSGPVFVALSLNSATVGTFQVDWSAFTVTSGTVSNYAGWYREASGDHRGTQSDVPDNLAVVVTRSSLELLDYTNNKIWMRFLQGTNNMLGATSANVKCRRVAWNNGLLLVAYGNGPGDAEGGAAIWIDFTMDTIRWYRSDGSTTTGALYRGTYDRVDGALQLRNSATGGWSGDNSDYAIQNNRVYDVDMYYSSPYLYKAIATVAGLTMTRWQRWYLYKSPREVDNSVSTEVTRIRWCELDQSTGELFYMDNTKIYSEAKGGGSGWEDAMDGGTFNRDTEKTLPGARGVDSQYMAVRYGGAVFVPTDAGVYRVAWPSGSWELFYGAADSGATHEILPGFGHVTHLALGDDGTSDLLLVGLSTGRVGNVVAVKLSDNTRYGSTQSKLLRQPNTVVA